MLRVGLTGGLGSGKSTAARIFAGLGAYVVDADAIGRDLMQPGRPVFDQIVERFGGGMLEPDGTLDRGALARIVFNDPNELIALNAIVHPAVIAHQESWMSQIGLREPDAVVMIESALLFETVHGPPGHGGSGGWQSRFDCIVLVTAPEETRIARFVARSAGTQGLAEHTRAALEAEAHRRIAIQWLDERKASMSDFILVNSGALKELEWQIDRLWPILFTAARHGTL